VSIITYVFIEDGYNIDMKYNMKFHTVGREMNLNKLMVKKVDTRVMMTHTPCIITIKDGYCH